MEQNKQILHSMIERQAASIYSKTRDAILAAPAVAANAFVAKMVTSYITGNQKQWFAWMDEQIDTIVDGAFLDPDTTMDEAVKNAGDLVNEAVGQALEKAIGISPGTISIALEALL